MNYQQELIDFSIKGFARTQNQFDLNGKHSHVLKNKANNFFGRKPDFKFHRWAGSFKSSQALAFNIFSGVEHAKFEYDLWALDNNTQHKACIDVAIENNNVVQMFEVKMFEIVHLGNNKIFNKLEQQKYFELDNYVWNKQIAESFIHFIQNIQISFKDQFIYGEGIKQLCCHILGILNEMTIDNGKLRDKKVELFSLCFDNPFTPKFEKDLINYKETLLKFKNILDQYLREINMDSKIKFNGFLSLNDYIENNSVFLGTVNCEYIIERYLKCDENN